MSDNLKILWWGPHPNERDGGMIVTYYQLRKYNELFPLDEHYGIPKNYDELDPSVLPFVTYFGKQYVFDEGKRVEVMLSPFYMRKFGIPIVVAFHIAEAIDDYYGAIKEVGGFTVLWQTVHWENDQIFKSKTLSDLDFVVAPTKFAEQTLMTKGKVKRSHITTIPHGVPTDKFYPHESLLKTEMEIKEDSPIILYVGRLDLWKGVQQLIPCVKPLIRDYNATFIIRGGPRNLEKSKELDYIFTTMANKPAYKNNFIYLPDWQSPAFMEELMNMCDIYVSPSAHEGFNVPLIEAMSCMKPVVTTDLANHREILSGTGNEATLLVPKVDVGLVNELQTLRVPSVDNILGALVGLIENPEERKVRGIAGRKKVLAEYDLANVCTNWKKLFHQILPENYDMNVELAKRMLLT